MTEPAPPSAESLAAAARAAGTRGLPPVHLWNPPYCGELDIRIAGDGTWYYLGTPIGRPALVKLFASILKREGDRYFLVTPVEKVGITVDDAPLFVEDFTASGEGREQILTFHTRTGDEVSAGRDHPMEFKSRSNGGETIPYVMVRSQLWGRIDRKSFFRLAELGCHEVQDGSSWFGLWSQGVFFPIVLSSDLS